MTDAQSSALTDAPRTPITADPPLLGGVALLRQRWEDLGSFHWRYDPGVVRALLPAGLEADTFDGAAWVGLIPFHMRGVRIGPGPTVPGLGSFVEINVRTYVVDRSGHRGVWFWSLDVPRSAIVGVARSGFSLPYCWGASTHTVEHVDGGERHRYTHRRRWPRAAVGGTAPSADIAYTVGERLADEEVGELDHFLSARWSLFTVRRGRLVRGDVDHERWPIHRVTDVHIESTLIEAAGLPTPVGEPHAFASPGVGVQIARLRRVGGGVPQ